VIDTHCHLNAEVFKDRVEPLLQEAKQQGVHQCFVVGWNQASSLDAVLLAKQHPSIKAIVGLHPVDTEHGIDVSWLHALITENREYIIAVGEIGFDYYWHKDLLQHQQQAIALGAQLDIAQTYNLPVVIHCRDAYDALLDYLQKRGGMYRGIMHCFGGTLDQLQAFLQLGFDISFGGPITFKNAQLAREVLSHTPIDRLHLETDSPYLAPHPHRGKENTPILLPLVFEKAKEVLRVTSEILEKNLQTNVEKLFHVKTL
jgi:TatD DNase family protein